MWFFMLASMSMYTFPCYVANIHKRGLHYKKDFLVLVYSSMSSSFFFLSSSDKLQASINEKIPVAINYPLYCSYLVTSFSLYLTHACRLQCL